MNHFRILTKRLMDQTDLPPPALTIDDITPPGFATHPRTLTALTRKWAAGTEDCAMDWQDTQARLLRCIEAAELAGARLHLLTLKLNEACQHAELIREVIQPLVVLSSEFIEELAKEEDAGGEEYDEAEAEAEEEFEAEAERVRDEDEALAAEAHKLVADHISSRPFLTLEQITPPEDSRTPLTYLAREWLGATQPDGGSEAFVEGGAHTLIACLEAAELASQQLMYLAVQVNPPLAAETVRPMNALALRLEREASEAVAENEV